MIGRHCCTTISASVTSCSANSTMPRNTYSAQFELDGNLQAAHYNMVMLYLRRAMQGQPISKAAFVHATRAIEIGPETADLYHVVAALYAMAARQDPALIQPAIEYVGKSVELGFDPKGIHFRHLLLRIAEGTVLPRCTEKNRHRHPSRQRRSNCVDPLDTLVERLASQSRCRFSPHVNVSCCQKTTCRTRLMASTVSVERCSFAWHAHLRESCVGISARGAARLSRTVLDWTPDSGRASQLN